MYGKLHKPHDLADVGTMLPLLTTILNIHGFVQHAKSDVFSYFESKKVMEEGEKLENLMSLV